MGHDSIEEDSMDSFTGGSEDVLARGKLFEIHRGLNDSDLKDIIDLSLGYA